MVDEVRNEQANKEKAGFTMGEYDYARYNSLLQEADYLNKVLLTKDTSVIFPFYCCLKVLWKNLRPISDLPTQEEVDTFISEIDRLFKDWRARDRNFTRFIPNGLISQLDVLYTSLLLTKQKMGLGIPTKSDKEKEEKLV